MRVGDVYEASGKPILVEYVCTENNTATLVRWTGTRRAVAADQAERCGWTSLGNVGKFIEDGMVALHRVATPRAGDLVTTNIGARLVVIRREGNLFFAQDSAGVGWYASLLRTQPEGHIADVVENLGKALLHCWGSDEVMSYTVTLPKTCAPPSPYERLAVFREAMERVVPKKVKAVCDVVLGDRILWRLWFYGLETGDVEAFERIDWDDLDGWIERRVNRLFTLIGDRATR